jgi:hypothetical protein
VEEKPSKVGWVMGGIGVVFFAVFIFYSVNPRWFGERFIHFAGSIKGMRALDDSRLLVVETVEAGGGEDGPTTVGDRWRIVEVKTGKILAGPYYIDSASWSVIRGERLISQSGHGLYVRDFKNQLVADLGAWKGVANLDHEKNDLQYGVNGAVTAMSDDGRFFSLDLDTLKATRVDTRAQEAKGFDDHERTYPKGLDLKGSPRAQVNGSGPDYLEASWIQDPATQTAIKAGGGYLMLHQLRLDDAKFGPGRLISSVNAEGTEIWRYTLPFPHFFNVAVFGDLLVIGVDERGDNRGPGWLRVLELATGKELWKLTL